MEVAASDACRHMIGAAAAMWASSKAAKSWSPWSCPSECKVNVANWGAALAPRIGWVRLILDEFCLAYIILPVCMRDLHLWPSSLGNTTKESVNQHATSCLIHSNLRESSQCSSTSSCTFFLKTKHARHSEPTLRHFQVVALKRTVSIPDFLQSPRGLTAQEGHDDLKSIMGTCASQA